jgi:hypothetical protein
MYSFCPYPSRQCHLRPDDHQNDIIPLAIYLKYQPQIHPPRLCFQNLFPVFYLLLLDLVSYVFESHNDADQKTIRSSSVIAMDPAIDRTIERTLANDRRTCAQTSKPSVEATDDGDA